MTPADVSGDRAGDEAVPVAATVDRQPPGAEQLKDTVAKAKAGDSDSWNRLVERFGQTVWTAVRAADLDPAASTQAAHATWLRFGDGLTGFTDPEQTEPEQIENWLVVTARREASRYQLLHAAARDSL